MGDNQNVDDIQKLDPGYAVGGQKKKNGYVTEDGNEQGMQGSPLEGGERMGSGCDKPQSVLAESDQEDVVRTDAEYDQEKVHSSYENNHNRGEMDELPGSYFHKSSFEFKERTFNSDKGTEDSNHSQEFTMTVDDKRAKEIEGSSVVHGQNTSSRDNKVMNDALRKSQDESKSSYNNIEGDFIQSPNGTLSSPFRPPAADIEGEGKNGSADIDVEQANENYNYSRNSPIESRKINVPNSAPQSPESSPTHEKSPQRLSTNKDRPLDLHEGDVDSPTPSRLKISFSPERSDPVKRVSPQRGLSPSYRQTSPERPLQESNQKDGRPLKRKSASPERHYSPRKHRRQERSISRSPIRRRDSGSRYGREHRDRSRSRSPYNRDRYRLPRYVCFHNFVFILQHYTLHVTKNV